MADDGHSETFISFVHLLLGMGSDSIVIPGEHHAGIIRLSSTAAFEDAVKAAAKLASRQNLKEVWVRRVSQDSWGIEFLAACDSSCKQQSIQDEIESWLAEVKAALGVSAIRSVDISGELLIVKSAPH